MSYCYIHVIVLCELILDKKNNDKNSEFEYVINYNTAFRLLLDLSTLNHYQPPIYSSWADNGFSS